MSGEVVRVTCTHDCQDACSALVFVDSGGHATEIKADPSHPITGRHLCVKVDRYLERVYSPDRLLTPLRRVGPKGSGKFQPIEWDDALDEVTTRWQTIIRSEGAESLLGYSYLGSMGVLDAFGTMQALFNRLGATQLERSICGPQWFALSGITGQVWSDPENLVDADTIVAWGTDPVSTSIHTWELIRRARKERGAKLVVVDPIRSRTAKYADLHLRPHPGTDGALALAVGHVIVRDQLEDRDYVERRTTDVALYRDAVSTWTPERAAATTGVSAEAIVEFAHLYAGRRPAAIKVGVGMQRSYGAGSALRAIQCLPALTGQWQWPAGGLSGAVSLGQLNMAALSRPDFVPPHTRQVNMIQLGRVLTDPAMQPAIKSLFVWNSNPAVIAADQQRVLAGLARTDLFTVVHEQFMTDTARYADVVFPATTMLEHADLVGSWGFSYLSWNEAAIAPIGQSKSNAELARLLAAGMGLTEDIFLADDHELMELALAGSAAERSGVGAASLRSAGFERVGGPRGTATKVPKFAFSSAPLGDAGLHPVAEYRPPAQVPSDSGPFPLRLVTLKRHYSINSSYSALPVMRHAEPNPIALIHPFDAASRAISDGDLIHVHNEFGGVRYLASVSDDVPPGTVAVPFGRPGISGLSGDESGANSLTSDRLGDLANGPTFCDNLVQVERSDESR